MGSAHRDPPQEVAGNDGPGDDVFVVDVTAVGENFAGNDPGSGGGLVDHRVEAAVVVAPVVQVDAGGVIETLIPGRVCSLILYLR